MPKRIFVGNLPFSATEGELNDLFADIGAVESATIITDRYSGRSRGFGFVEMSSDDDADKAIDQLNGHALGDREIVVNEAKPRGERRPPRGGGRDRF